MKNFVAILFVSMLVNTAFSQNIEKGIFVTYPIGFYEKVIMKDITGKDPDTINRIPAEYFRVDFTGNQYPTNISDYKTTYHSNPVSQGNSGTCWAYSATAFMESEVFRLNGEKVKISELYTVYWEYVERAADFVKTRGETTFGEGSEANAIRRIMRNHGMMPYSAYSGLKDGFSYNNHRQMVEEIETYLISVKESNIWDEKIVVKKVKQILDSYIGTPTESFKYKEKKFTPMTFMTDFLKLDPNKYFSFMSTKEFPYNEKHELIEFDNWFHGDDYYNLSLDDYMYLLNKAITSGYTISLCGDVSEPGHDQISEVAIIPSFDIPAEYINDDARQLRLTNMSTTDDHCIQVVGYQKVGDDYWYLIKDSGSGAFDGPNKGYRFFHEDYIKLKMMNYMIHVDVAREMLDKIIK